MIFQSLPNDQDDEAAAEEEQEGGKSKEAEDERPLQNFAGVFLERG